MCLGAQPRWLGSVNSFPADSAVAGGAGQDLYTISDTYLHYASSSKEVFLIAYRGGNQ